MRYWLVMPAAGAGTGGMRGGPAGVGSNVGVFRAEDAGCGDDSGNSADLSGILLLVLGLLHC